MRDERYLEWVKATRFLGRVHPMLTDLANGLGALDSQLMNGDKTLLSRFEAIPGAIETPVELEHRTLSLLWVLGAYELVRTLSQRVAKDSQLISSEGRAALDRLKLTLERIRMPLAKLEKSRRGPAADFPIAFPVLEGGSGMCWRIGPKQYQSRRAVADMLLEMLRLAGPRH